MFRASHKGEGIDHSGTTEGARGIVRGQPPGRYELRANEQSRPSLFPRREGACSLVAE